MHSRGYFALLAALLGAGAFAVSAVLQQRAAREAPRKESLSWRLIADLLHRRTWLAGMGCVVLGYLLQAVALGLAPVAFVEPVIGIEVVLALPLAARFKRKHLGRREWAGAASVVIGVGGFLALSNPAGGNPDPGLVRWALVGLPTLGVVGIALAAGRGSGGTRRAPLLACGAGLCFALVALLTQSAVHVLEHQGLLGMLTRWQVYAVAVLGPVGFTIAQSAYQAGPLAMSLPVLDSLEPTVAVVLAALAFHQHLSLVAPRLAGELCCAVLAVVGIFLLTRSPLVIFLYQQTEHAKDAAGEGAGVPAAEGDGLAAEGDRGISAAFAGHDAHRERLSQMG